MNKCPKSSQSCRLGDYQMNKEHLLNKVNKCDRSVATMKQRIFDLLILNAIFGSFWIFALLYFTS